MSESKETEKEENELSEGELDDVAGGALNQSYAASRFAASIEGSPSHVTSVEGEPGAASAVSVAVSTFTVKKKFPG